MNTFNLNLDLDKRGGVAQWVNLRQGDRRGTELRATIYDHGTQAGGGYTCRVSIRLPGEGNEYYRETATYTNGVAVVTVDEEYAAAIVGVTEGYFELLQGDAVIASTESFGVRILRSAQDGAVPGDKYDSAIEDALAELDEATGRISQMVVDATEEYLEAHPELTTTVQDNSLTDAKLIQHGGILDRVARLWHRLDNLLTATPAESDTLTVTDAAKTPLAGLALYGRSTQDGTPTPSAPVPIVSVGPNLYQQTLFDAGTTQVRSGVTYTYLDGGSFIASGTATSSSTAWGNTSTTSAAVFVTLPAGTYTACAPAPFGITVRKLVNGTNTAVGSVSSGILTFTLDEESQVLCYPNVPNGTTVEDAYGWVMLVAGSDAAPAYVPYGSVGLWAKRTSDATQQSVTPIPLQGHALRSLPDGTRDEVTVDHYGHATLIQRVGAYTFDGSETPASSTAELAYYNVSALGIPAPQKIPRGATGFCDHYAVNDNWTSTNKPDNTVVINSSNFSGTERIVFYDSAHASSFKTWLQSNPVTIQYPLATPVTIDLGTVDPVALQGPDMTAQAVPTAPFALTYERDLNVTLARLEAAIADAATA